MKLFIDDSGSFGWNPPGISLFGCVVLTDQEYSTIIERFQEWKRRQLGLSESSEVKGKNLTPQQQVSFVRSMILAHPSIFIPASAGVDSKKLIKEHAIKFKDSFVEMLKITSQKVREHGKKILTREYYEQAGWTNNRSIEQFLWLYCLAETIRCAEQYAMVRYMAPEFDQEFENIEIVIDKNFIRDPAPTQFWREWLRNYLFLKSQGEPVAVFREWRERGHPFLRKYSVEPGLLNCADLYRNHMGFEDSKNSKGLQIADVVSNVVLPTNLDSQGLRV